MENYYLMFEYGQANIGQWDDMMPYERDIYLNILIAKQEEKIKRAQENR